MNSREDNEVPELECNLRNSIRENSDSICANCIHILDSCKSMHKKRSEVNGYVQINDCTGFEELH